MVIGMEINLDARRQRHQKIWIDSKIIQTKRPNTYFIRKMLVLALAFWIMDFCAGQIYSEDTSEEIYSEKPIESQSFLLEEDWFVAKREMQTEKRDTSWQSQVFEHVVEPWDTITSLATEYQIKPSTIIDANPWIKSWLKAGQIVRILPIDWIFLVLDADTKITEIASMYKAKEEDIRKQNRIWSWNILIRKWTSIIIPWIRAPESIIARTPAITAPSSWANYSYKWPKSWTFIRPCEWGITQYFRAWHFALDIGNRNKWPIFAAANGVVKEATYWWNWWYWNMVVIDHGNWVETLYWHNEKLYVKPWDKVKQWQTIAWMWRTWRVRWTTWIHLHFEVIVNWRKRNPLAYF